MQHPKYFHQSILMNTEKEVSKLKVGSVAMDSRFISAKPCNKLQWSSQCNEIYFSRPRQAYVNYIDLHSDKG